MRDHQSPKRRGGELLGTGGGERGGAEKNMRGRFAQHRENRENNQSVGAKKRAKGDESCQHISLLRGEQRGGRRKTPKGKINKRTYSE